MRPLHWIMPFFALLLFGYVKVLQCDSTQATFMFLSPLNMSRISLILRGGIWLGSAHMKGPHLRTLLCCHGLEWTSNDLMVDHDASTFTLWHTIRRWESLVAILLLPTELPYRPSSRGEGQIQQRVKQLFPLSLPMMRRCSWWRCPYGYSLFGCFWAATQVQEEGYSSRAWS